MPDRIATNRGSAGCYQITTDITSGTPSLGTGYGGTPTCTAAVGTATTRAIADADLQAWNNALKGAAETAGTDKNGGGVGAPGRVNYDLPPHNHPGAGARQGLGSTPPPPPRKRGAARGQKPYRPRAPRPAAS